MQVPVALALFYGGPLAMHVFKQDAVVSAVRFCPPWPVSGLHNVVWLDWRIEQETYLCCLVQLVQTYTRGMLPGLWPYIWSCVIMKVHKLCSTLARTFDALLLFCKDSVHTSMAVALIRKHMRRRCRHKT